MSDEPFLPRLWREMKRRRVVPLLVVYPGVAWGMIEAVPTVLTYLGAPQPTTKEVGTCISILALAAFPLVLLLTWLFQVVPDSEAPREEETPPSRWHRLFPAFSVLLVTAGCVTLATVLWPPPPVIAKVPRPVEPDALALLPSQVLTRDQDVMNAAASITHRLSDRLAALPGIHVRPPFEADRLAQAALRSDSLARILGVETLIVSTAEWMGDRLTMTYRIVEGPSGRQLERVQVAAGLPSNDATVNELVDNLEVKLRQALGRVNHRWTKQTSSRDEMAEARLKQAENEIALYHRAIREGDVDAALRALQQADSAASMAAARDPAWAEPLVRRSWIARERAILFLTNYRERAVRAAQSSWRFADAALRVAPGEAEALRLRGLAAYERVSLDTAVDLDRDRWLEEADADLRLAQSRHPNRAEVRYDLALVKQEQELPAEAYAVARDAYDYDTYLRQAQSAVGLLFDLSFDLSRDEDAARWCDEGRRRFPGDREFHECRLTLMGWGVVPADTAEAASLVARALAAYPPTFRGPLRSQLSVLEAAVYVQAGDTARARDALDLVTLEAPPAAWVTAAGAWLLMGEREPALRELRRYVTVAPGEADHLRRRRILRPLFGDREFEALVAGGRG